MSSRLPPRRRYWWGCVCGEPFTGGMREGAQYVDPAGAAAARDLHATQCPEWSVVLESPGTSVRSGL